MADGSLRLMQDARLDPAFDITRAWNLEAVPALPDEDWGNYLRRIGFTDAQLDYVRRSFANAVGDSMPYISAEAILAELRDTSNGEGDFRILDGYNALTDYLADGLGIRLNTIVQQIDWSGKGVRVETNQGAFEADQVVITLPVGVLQSGKVEFVPALPAEKQAAITNLRMGPVIKLVYKFEQPITPPEIMAFFSAGNPPMWWSPSFGQDTDQVVWSAFVSGDGARDLLALGESGALEAALDTLGRELDCPDLKPVDMRLVNWPADPFALGGYSVATPRHADARRILAQPTANKLFWAGEATVEASNTATVHGAYVSGRRAASEILANNHQQ